MNTLAYINRKPSVVYSIIITAFLCIIMVYVSACRDNLNDTYWVMESVTLDGVTYRSGDDDFDNLLLYSGEYSLQFTEGSQIKITMAGNFNEAGFPPYTIRGNNITVIGVNGNMTLTRNNNKITLSAPIYGGQAGTMVFVKK